MPKEQGPYHITATFKPYEWQKYGHKFKLDYVLSYEVDGGLLQMQEEDRLVVIPLDNLQTISIVPQDKYEEFEQNKRGNE